MCWELKGEEKLAIRGWGEERAFWARESSMSLSLDSRKGIAHVRN